MDEIDLSDIKAAYEDNTNKYLINTEVDFLPLDHYFEGEVIDELQSYFGKNVINIADYEKKT
jgi:hypothetical protein